MDEDSKDRFIYDEFYKNYPWLVVDFGVSDEKTDISNEILQCESEHKIEEEKWRKKQRGRRRKRRRKRRR